MFNKPSHKSVAARHIKSGIAEYFDNVFDRSEYVAEEIRDAWEFFFVAPNGYEWGHQRFN